MEVVTLREQLVKFTNDPSLAKVYAQEQLMSAQDAAEENNDETEISTQAEVSAEVTQKIEAINEKELDIKLLTVQAEYDSYRDEKVKQIADLKDEMDQ